MREKSPTVRPVVTRPLSTLPLPDSQSMISLLTLRRREHRGWSYHQDGDTQEQLPRRNAVMTVTSALDTVLAKHLAAVNAFDEDALVDDHVTIDVTEVIDHYGDTIVRGR